MFLGVHALNQTIFGFTLGLWIAFTMEFCWRRGFALHCEQIVNNGRAFYLSDLIVSIVFVIILLIFVDVQYGVQHDVVDIKVEWTKNIDEKCGTKIITKAAFTE